MLVGSQQSEDDAVPQWKLDDWNQALHRHFFAVPPKEIVAPLVRLYVSAEDLRAAAGVAYAPEEARSAFIGSIRRAVGPRSLALDASRRRKLWNPAGTMPPPFLSHLLLTCMVANDLAEELRWTGNFRDRLSCALGTQSQPLLERLRLLWEDLASWSIRQNLAGVGCRQLRLPRVPDSGYHSIIGYSIRLAIPSRRDQAALTTLFRQHDLDGSEPDLNSVLRVVGGNIDKFSADFGDVFRDFVSGVKSLPSSVLFHTTFWTAVREVAAAGLQKAERAESLRTRLELEDDDGRFWLTMTSDTDIQSAEVKAVLLPEARRSSFRFVLTGPEGKSLAEGAFCSVTSDAQTERMFANSRAASADGVVLFEESEDYVYVHSSVLPSSGPIRALVADSLNSNFRQAVEACGIRPEITKSSRPGWFEWRGLSAEGLRRVEFSAYPSLLAVRSLRPTLPAPEIKIRGGIQFGSSFVALSNSLPHVEVASAESVSIEIAGGDWVPLERLTDTEDCWLFSAMLSAEQLLGKRRVVAFASSIPIAEQGISFVENAFTTDYKRPSDPSRWLVESARIDTIALCDDTALVTPTSQYRKSERWQKDAAVRIPPLPVPLVQQPASLLELTTLLCTRFASQRGISEGAVLQIMTSVLGVKVSQVWPILRGWVEGGMLDVLTDARWRARIYFGRAPQLLIHRRDARYEAVLTGLIPPFLLERFYKLSTTLGVAHFESRSTSEAVPPLPRCHSHHLGLLTQLAQELGLPSLAEVGPVEDLLTSVQSLAEQHTSTSQDSWPVYRNWDWNTRVFMENTVHKTSSGISIQWCRRDDGPDRFKLYRDDSLLWWTRSRTWAILAAFTLAGVSVFKHEVGAVLESQGDSLYLPLPVARIVSWIGPINPGPVKTADGRTAYRYTFRDEKLKNFILNGLWPGLAGTKKKLLPAMMMRCAAILQTGSGPLVPLPAALKRSLLKFGEEYSFQTPNFVPATTLPELYAILGAQTKGDIV